MDWENERYVRWYTRDTVEWLCLSWKARGLFGLILRVTDRAGVIELGRVGTKGLAALLHAPWVEIEDPLTELLGDGCVQLQPLDDGTERLLLRNFMSAQEAKMSDAQRQRESRARRRDLKSKRVTKRDASESRNVTPSGHDSLQNVTAGHAESHDVTPSHPNLSSLSNQTNQSTKAPTKRSRAKRMRDDWRPPPGVYRWAFHHYDVLFLADSVTKAIEDFRDYWIGVSDKRGAKSESGWLAAFRTWLKRMRERAPGLPMSQLRDDPDATIWGETPRGFDWQDGGGFEPGGTPSTQMRLA